MKRLYIDAMPTVERKLTKTEQNKKLAATYFKINDDGRNILDGVVQKLSEINWVQEDTVKGSNDILHNQKSDNKEKSK